MHCYHATASAVAAGDSARLPIRGYPGRHLHQALAQMSMAFEAGQPMISLDYAKCFDHVSPPVVLAVMQKAGMPSALIELLRHAWRQERVLEFQGYARNGVVEVTSSLPQGDSLSPLALNILLAAACFHIQHEVGSNYSSSVFLDDRTIAAAPRTLLRVIDLWNSWSETFGLVENNRKRAAVGRCARQLDILRRHGWAQYIKDQVRVLGASFCAASHTTSACTEQRTSEALRMAVRLRKRGIPIAVRRDLWRTRIIPKASWGYLFQPPTAQVCRQFEQSLKKILNLHAQGSRFLQTLLEGHNMDFGFMSRFHAIASLQSSGFWAQVAENSATGTWFGTAAAAMRSLGWQSTASSTTFTAEGQQLDVVAERCKEVQHKLRDQWRRQLHSAFTQQNRRDSAGLRGWRFHAGQVGTAIRLYQEASTEGRAVLTGAALSTAFCGKRKFGAPETVCPWCQDETVPDWHHLAWCCPGVPMADQRPQIPDEVPALRLGWPVIHEHAVKAGHRWPPSERPSAKGLTSPPQGRGAFGAHCEGELCEFSLTSRVSFRSILGLRTVQHQLQITRSTWSPTPATTAST